jgi:hypothetical protein
MMNEKIIENLTVTGKRYAYVSDQLELVVSSKGKKTFYMRLGTTADLFTKKSVIIQKCR